MCRGDVDWNCIYTFKITQISSVQGQYVISSHMMVRVYIVCRKEGMSEKGRQARAYKSVAPIMGYSERM